MGFIHGASSGLFSFVVCLLTLQLGGLPPDSPNEDPFSRATTPTAQFLVFNKDFSSLERDRFLQWIHPDRGLIKNGILLTKQEAEVEYQAGKVQKSGLISLNIHFNYGRFSGGPYYQADCWVEYKAKVDNKEQWFRFHNIFVFEIIDSLWYLVQSEYVISQPNVIINLESAISSSKNVPPELRQFVTEYTAPAVPGLSPWPLLVGSSFGTSADLHPVEGKKLNGKTWKLTQAINEGKPTVMYFFSVHSLTMVKPEELDKQMRFLASLYETFGKTKLYIFGVTDESKEVVEWLGKSGYDKFAPLLDEGSILHLALNIDTHPSIVIFDSRGTVICISKGYRPASWDLVRGRIRQALAQSSKQKGS